MQLALLPTLPVVVLLYLGLFLFITDVCMSFLVLTYTRPELLPAFIKSKSKPAPDVDPQKAGFSSALLDNVNHEIRTPLAGIMASAQILHEVVGPAHQEFTAMLIENSRRMNNAISNVIEFVNLENTTYRVDTAPVELHRELETLVLPHQQEAASKGIDFQICPKNREVVLNTDPQLLRKVLGHLLDNAIKFTEQGSVSVSIEKESRWLHVEIKDTGIGINKEQLPDLCEPFWQESRGLTRAYSGQGLGLALTRRMLDLAGGKISIKTTPGSGSSFTVSYPYTD